MFTTLKLVEIETLKKILHVIDDKNDLFSYGKEFERRVARILSYAEKKKCSVLYDAEQSYIQKILDSSAFYYGSIYNKEFPTVLETVQCYLKDSPRKIEDFIMFFRENNLKLGLKSVRGAYIVEETKLSENLGYERLNWDSIDQTNTAYNNIMRRLVSVYRPGDKVISLVIIKGNFR